MTIKQGMQLSGGRGRVLQYDKATDFVLVDRGVGYQPFVVWSIDPKTYETFWGAYFKNLGDAVRKFEEKTNIYPNPTKHANHDWYVEGMVRAQRQADYGKLNSLKADLRKMSKANRDAIMQDFRDGYKAWYDAQKAGGVVVSGGVHARKNNPTRGSQHWIVKVVDVSGGLSRAQKEVASSYFDGTMTAAKKWFRRDRLIANYWGQPGYVITMQPNAIVLWDGYKKNPKGRKKFDPRLKTKKDCQWFALCENKAVTVQPHPILGDVPICQRCKDKYDRLSNPVARKKNPDNEIRELILFAENNEPLNNQFYSILKNLEKKAKKGTYDPVLAAKLWKYWIDNAVKEYNYEFLTRKRSLVQNVFSVQDRKDAAIQVEAQWRDDVFRGDNPIHKVGQQKSGPQPKKSGAIRIGKKKTWIAFQLRGSKVHYLNPLGWTAQKAKASKFATRASANKALYENYVSRYQHGLAESTVNATQIKKAISGRVSSAPGKARRSNPVGPTQKEVDRAANLFRDFTGEYPEGLQSVKLPVPKTGLVIGELDGVLYTTVRDGKTEKYKHDFKKSSRPHLIASNDGKSLHILGGEYEFTERGIEDK